MTNRGILIIISGFSGAGKGTLVKALVEKYDYKLSISATTRAPRPGEVHGKEYFFLTREEFESMIEDNRLIEWAEYVGNYYGTPKAYVEEQLEKGNHVILEIEIQGALKVKEQCPEAVLLFVTPPSAKVLKERLVGRGTESMDTINKRLSRAAKEAEYMSAYDYIIVNDELEACVEKTNAIIESETDRTLYRQDLIEELTKELKEFQEGE
jgi:guanylate kinase